jgi:subtilisin family serine protease
MNNPGSKYMRVWMVVFVLFCFAQPGLAAQFLGSEKVETALLQAAAQDGEVSYLVYLNEKADLTGAEAITDSDERGWFVYRALKEVADRTQAPLLDYLALEAAAGRVTEYKSFFSVNAIGVTSNGATLQELAAFDGVRQIRSLPEVSIPEPLPGEDEPEIDAVEWGVDRVRAPEVWDKGVFGQGIVVATIDTGVHYTHSALVNQYRGNLGGGSFNHNYNWWDPSNVCGNPSNVPCDNTDHGTHVTGTMVGDDGGSNQIGVAPQAEWIACKGCETNSCSSFALLECGDWILAPWNLNGQNPDPAKRPHVVNNSWSGGSGDPWYMGVVDSWRASGIFPAFANGNSGPSCRTSRSPGDYPQSFSSGATDINNNIAGFSSRGPSSFGGVTKPDVSAPGVNVRSSVPPNGYANFQGTSMASPHTAGVVAFLWSAYNGLNRDIPNTEKKLRPAAAIENTTQGCGGDGPTDHPNNVFGWGRDDAFQAFNPFNVYTDRSVYNSGNTMAVLLSLVNPLNSQQFVDIYVAVRIPGGDLLFYPGFGTTPVPLRSNYEISPLQESFDFNMLNYTFAGEPSGNYTWFSVMVPPGADPLDSNNWQSFDHAPFRKN